MDLSFPRFEFDAPLVVLPPDLAVMMVGVAARQAASPTAMFQFRLSSTREESGLFAPSHGAFEPRVAASIRRWKEM